MLAGCTPWPTEFADRYREQGYWKGETLGAFLRGSARRFAGRTAVVGAGRRWTYAGLDARADRMAAGLARLGIGAGDRVVVQLPNRPEVFEVAFALFRIGALPVYALPAHRRAELSYLCSFTEAAALVVADTDAGFDYRALAEQVRADTGGPEHVLVAGDTGGRPGLTRLEAVRDAGGAGPGATAEPDPGDAAFLQLSGGTTGLPKLIPRTHDDYLYSVRASAEICGLDTATVYLAALPAVHNFPMSSPGFLGVFAAGGTVVLAPDPSPATCLGLIEAEGVTHTAVVPPVAMLWLDAVAGGAHAHRDLSTLEVLQVGGAKFAPEAARRVRPTLGCAVQQVFGMAEGLVNYTRYDDDEETAATTQGRPISPDDEIRIVDSDGTEVPRGALGELHTRGPYTIRGYYKAPEHNAVAFTPDGFYRTGDLVRRTPTGHIVVEGRAKDQINRGGEKVAPDEVEDHLLAHPGVHDAAVVAMSDPFLGERACAYVESAGAAGGAYNVPWVLRIAGPLKAAALERALGDVLGRHTVLRTRFPADADGEPEQRVVAAGELPQPLLAVETLAEDADAQAARLDRAARAPFDLARDVPARFTLSTGGGEQAEHVLLAVFHHIAVDEWSQEPFLRDLDAAYRARCGGAEPEWEPLPVQYADYALWQRDLLGSADDPGSTAARQRGFWRDALAGLPAEIPLPADRPRSAAANAEGGLVRFSLPPELHRALARVAEDTGATPFMVLQSGVALLLHRMGGGADIPLGTPVTGRVDEALHDAVGMFLNTLVLRTDLAGDPAFRQLLERVRAADVAAFANADLPFDDVVDEVNPARAAGRNPLFQVMVSHQTRPEGTGELLGLRTRLDDQVVDTAKFDLEFVFIDRPGHEGLDAVVRYSADRFDRVTVAELAERLVGLLAAGAADPDRPVGELPLLVGGEREVLLGEWSAAARPVVERTLPELLAQGAGRAGAAGRGAVLVAAGAVLSRAEFDARVFRLARELVARGVGPESVVAVALPRSVDLVVALHAVVCAGAAYLPVEVDEPGERVAFVLGDARPAVVLCRSEDAARLPEVEGAATVALDAADIAARIAARPADPLADSERCAPLRGDHPAYVIYTSGSTGRPKGVVVSHRAIVNRLVWMQGAYGLGAADRVLLKTPVSFDVSVWELFWPFAAGAGLVVAEPGGHRDPAYLAELIRDAGVTVCHFVPSMLRVFVGAPEAARCASLRRVFASGEALGADLADRFAAVLPGAALANLYGPTEAAVDVTAFDAGSEGVAGAGVPIGRPVWNTGAYVLDERLVPVPAGVEGELYLSGVQLARGYAARAGLSAERFVADPFGVPGGRMYRTGDVVRWDRAGRLVFVGRSDFQVKVRGMRIEPGEIEHALTALPEVAGAVVVARETAAGAAQLAAYVTTAPGAAPPETADLLRSLAARLPAHMVPAAMTVLAQFPLTASGKLDRAALPEPDAAEPAGAGRPAAGPREELVCALFADLLGLEQVSAETGFFALGGDSILAIQLVGLARARGLELTPGDVFTEQTPERLALAAAAVGTADAAEAQQEVPDDGTGDVPLAPVMHWLRERGHEPRRFSQAMVLHTPVGADAERITAVLQALLDRHAMLRSRLDTRDGWRLYALAPGTVAAADVLTRRGAAGLDTAQLTRAAAEEARAAQDALDPERGAMIRAVWLDRGAGRAGRLLLVIHHLVVDGVSWGVLRTDLAAAWRAAAGGDPPMAPAPHTSYARWTRLLHTEARSAHRAAELNAWQQITAAPDRRATAIESAAGARLFGVLDPERDTAATLRRISVSLSTADTEALLTRVPETFHAGIEDVLLSALALAAAEWRADRADGGAAPEDAALPLALESHGREQHLFPGADVSRTVGWFTAVHPARIDVCGLDPADARAGGPAAGDALKRVKEQLRARPGDGGIGYGLLRYLNPDTAAELARDPEPPLLFNYLGRVAVAPEQEAWAVAPETGELPPGIDPGMPVRHPLEVNTVTRGGPDGPVLSATWNWPRRLLAEHDVRVFADAWFAQLRGLVAHAQSPDAGGHTPSDLALMDLGQDEIDEFEAEWRLT